MTKISAHLSKELRGQYKRRSIGARKGDEVKIISGEHAGKVGKITGVDSKNMKVFVEGVTIKRTVGTEKQVPIRPSKVVITSLELADNMRQRILLRKVKEVKVEKPKPVAQAAEAKPAVAPEVKAEEKAAEKVPEKKIPDKKEVTKPKAVGKKSAKAEKVKADG